MDIWKHQEIATGQGDDYTNSWCLLYYHYFKENYKLIATDLSKAPDANPKAIQQIILLKI